VKLETLSSSSHQTSLEAVSIRKPWVGGYYSTIGVPDTSYAMNYSSFLQSQNIAQRAFSVEDVLQSQGSLRFVDVVHRYSQNVTAACDRCNYNGYNVGWTQATTSLPLWYPYKKRDTEAFGIIPDCPEVLLAQGLQTHAVLLATAGVDFVLGDGTNLPGWPPTDPDAQADVRQMRPFEIIMESWNEMRENGFDTPAFGTWGRITGSPSSPSGTIWQEYLDRLYNNETYLASGLVVKDPRTGKKFFLAAEPGGNGNNDPIAVAGILSNGGRNDTILASAWVNVGPRPNASWLSSGQWSFESPCTQQVDGTLLFSNALRPDSVCNHQLNTNSPLGSEFSVSFSLGWNNIPFVSGGKMQGLFFKKQMQDVFLQHGKVDNIFIPSFNEYGIADLNFSTFFNLHNPYLASMGGADAATGTITEDDQVMFVDGFAYARARAWEPTIHDEGYDYELVSSCLRVLALNAITNASTCAVAGEECCVYHADEYVSPVWSLQRVDQPFAFVSSNRSLVTAFLSNSTGHYVQKCGPWLSDQYYLDFCGYSSPGSIGFDAVRGPFLVFDPVIESKGIPNATALYRCDASLAAQGSFLSLDEACEGFGVLTELIGYISTFRSGVMPRALRRCLDSYYYHTVDGPCQSDQGTLLGFVTA
jgi:hypothetical protein